MKRTHEPYTNHSLKRLFQVLLLCLKMKKFIVLLFVIGLGIPNLKAQIAANYSFPVVPVLTPALPDSMTFAGEYIDLTRSDLRERLDRELISFCYMHATTLLVIKRANRYFPEVEPILKACNLPDDFKYLMTIESNLIPTIKSPAGAVGLWQFMENTSKDYGLVVNASVDERYNTEKATRAACAYLKKARQACGDWLSAAAAYNAGQQYIVSALRAQQESCAINLWLNNETSRYIFRILAIKLILENPEKYGFFLTREQLYAPIRYERVKVSDSIADLVLFAKTHGIRYAELKEANLWLRSDALENKSGRTYVIRIPKK